MKVDLNCDMGESYGMYTLGNDEEMMKYISSANIACGFHAGDPHAMRKTVELAKEHGVQIGAHPGFPDTLGFGRREMNCTDSEIKDYIVYQIGALREFASIYDISLQHCKPHGALYTMAMEDERMARAILEAIAQINENMIVFALNNSAVLEIGKQMGIKVATEVFADREHTETGAIVPVRKGQKIEDFDALANRVLKMVRDGVVRTPDGVDAKIHAQTICIHGDTPDAPVLAKHITECLATEGIEITSIDRIL